MSCSRTERFNSLIEKIVNNNSNLKGVFFTNLEFAKFLQVLDLYLEKINNKKIDNQNILSTIFITKTMAAGIKVFVYKKKELLYSKSIEYQHTKSIEYNQGVITCEIEDAALFVKKDKQISPANIELILFLPQTILEYYQNKNFGFNNVFLVNPIFFNEYNKIYLRIAAPDEGLLSSDIALAYQSLSAHEYPAHNEEVHRYIRLNQMNRYIFRPLTIFSLFILFIFTSFAYENKLLITQISDAKIESAEAAKKLTEAKSTFKEVNIDKIIDIIYLIESSRQSLSNPVEVINNFIALNSSNISITNMNWKSLQNQSGLYEFKIIFHTNSLSRQAILSEFKEYILKIRKAIPNHEISYTRLIDDVSDSVALKIVILSKPQVLRR